MYIFKKINDLQRYLSFQPHPVGFVPTMGALHQGHISLVTRSLSENSLNVCSIFVNPTQFNEKNDFDNYPKTIEADISLLSKVNNQVLFLPSVTEMYPDGFDNAMDYELGYLDTILDGKQRPGHFNGVCNIVHRLLNAVQPDTMYLGEKDFQQCMVIKHLIQEIKSPARLITCPTLREPNGLAMSSRNERLSTHGRQLASIIYETMLKIRTGMATETFQKLSSDGLSTLASLGFENEYIMLADADHLELLDQFDPARKMVVLIATRLEGVRLIDNLRLNY